MHVTLTQGVYQWRVYSLLTRSYDPSADPSQMSAEARGCSTGPTTLQVRKDVVSRSAILTPLPWPSRLQSPRGNLLGRHACEAALKCIDGTARDCRDLSGNVENRHQSEYAIALSLTSWWYTSSRYFSAALLAWLQDSLSKVDPRPPPHRCALQSAYRDNSRLELEHHQA